MLNKIIKSIEDQSISISEWILGFTGIFFVRLLLESLSSITRFGVAPLDVYTVIHYYLYFICVTLGSILIFGFFYKNYSSSVKIFLYGFTLIWLAPIIDLVLSLGRGHQLTYIFDSGKYLIYNFLTFFGKNLTYGATIGIRIQVLVSLIGIAFLLYLKSKSKIKPAISILIIYIFIFSIFNLPGVIYTITNSYNSVTGFETLNYFEELVSNSNIYHNTLSEGVNSVSISRFFELGFNKLMSQIFYVLSFIFLLTLFYKIDKKKFIGVIKNSRPERIVSYLLLLLCGSGYAFILNLGNKNLYWVDIASLICLLISWFCLWMHAVHTNDVVDVDIDKISNKNRPITSGLLNKEDMNEIGYLWLIFALLGSWSVGFYPFFMSLIYIFSYSIYSMYPLRLRRFPIVSSFLISIAGLSTILSGFFFVSSFKDFRTFPIFLSMGILIMITLAINTKDLKDVEGDSENKIMTIPTIFPKHGFKIVGICFGLSLILVPIFLKMYELFFISIPCAILGYIYINKKPYSETPLFYVRFTFLGLVGLVYIIKYFRFFDML